MGGGYLAPEQEDEQQTFFSQPQLPQQVIDEALCIGFNDQNSRLIICAYFMKDKPLEDNAAFLQKRYGTNGAGLFIQDREYAIWYDPEGIRVSTGRTVQKRYTTLVTWEQAAKRIRELLDLGRYMPQSEIGRVQDFERMELAKSLIYARREFSDEARDAGYLPLTTLTYSARGGFPEIEAQMQRLLEDRDTLSQLVDEWTWADSCIPEVSWVCMLGAAPFAALGFVSYHGMPAEKFLWVWFRSEILEPKVIRFQPTNLYYEIMKDTIAKHEKEARKQHESD